MQNKKLSHKRNVNSQKTMPPSDSIYTYKGKFFNWSINTKYLCNRKTCDNKCKKGKDEFSFYEISVPKLFAIFEKLNDYRTWNWQKIEQYNNTSCGKMAINKLDVKGMVEKHLSKHKLDEHDELYKIEITNRHRIWGIRIDEIFYLIWNDPEHHFYKHENGQYTPPKNT